MNSESLQSKTQKFTREFWDSQAQEWGESHGRSKFFDDFYSQHKNELGPDVLDIGCGNGKYMVPFMEDGFSVVGLDSSEGMISAAKKRFNGPGMESSLVRGESHSLPFDDSSFDSVVSIGAIHHNTMKYVEESFKEVSRVLKKGKYFLFFGRSSDDTSSEREIVEDFRKQGFGFSAIDKDGDKKGILKHFFNFAELEKLGQNNNLEIMATPEEESLVEDPKSPTKKHVWLWVVFKKK